MHSGIFYISTHLRAYKIQQDFWDAQGGLLRSHVLEVFISSHWFGNIRCSFTGQFVPSCLLDVWCTNAWFYSWQSLNLHLLLISPLRPRKTKWAVSASSAFRNLHLLAVLLREMAMRGWFCLHGSPSALVGCKYLPCFPGERRTGGGLLNHETVFQEEAAALPWPVSKTETS